MKYLLSCFFILFISETNAQQFTKPQLREMFLPATERKGALDTLLIKLESIKKKSPAEQSYLGICNGLCCQHVEGNWSKLMYVVKAKNLLNEAVERDSKDPELRFMRLMLEHFLPSFLGLNKHIADDLSVIFGNPKFIDESPTLKRKVIDFLLWSKRCNTEQTRLLEKELIDLNKLTADEANKKNQ